MESAGPHDRNVFINQFRNARRRHDARFRQRSKFWLELEQAGIEQPAQGWDQGEGARSSLMPPLPPHAERDRVKRWDGYDSGTRRKGDPDCEAESDSNTGEGTGPNRDSDSRNLYARDVERLQSLSIQGGQQSVVTSWEFQMEFCPEVIPVKEGDTTCVAGGLDGKEHEEGGE